MATPIRVEKYSGRFDKGRGYWVEAVAIEYDDNDIMFISVSEDGDLRTDWLSDEKHEEGAIAHDEHIPLGACPYDHEHPYEVQDLNGWSKDPKAAYWWKQGWQEAEKYAKERK